MLGSCVITYFLGINVSKTKKTLNYLVVMPLFRDNVNVSYILPLGLLYASSALKKANFNVFTVNLNHVENPFEYLRETILQNRIDVVLSGALSPQYAEVKQIFDQARAVSDTVINICGGGLISGDPVNAMAALEVVDFGIVGEGEITVVELCRTLEKGTSLHDVDGIIFRDNGSCVLNKKRSEIADIDTISWPDYEGFAYDKFLDISTVGNNGLNCQRAAMILTSRSCPYSCTFCFHTSGKKYRQRSLDDVFKEIDFLIEHYNILFLYISDELFSVSEKRVHEFCERIKPYGIPWNSALRLDTVTEKMLEEMKDANCVSIGLGIESADNNILRSMKKNITIEQIESGLEKIYQAGISIFGNFIFGDLEETRESANRTIDWWKKNQKYGIFMKMIKVYPGTYLYAHALEQGIIADPVQFLRDGCPPVNVSKMSDSDMADLVKQITLLPLQENAQIAELELLSVDRKTSCCDLSGRCHHCGKKSVWPSVMLFTLNYVTCRHCHGKMATAVPRELVQTIDKSIAEIIASGHRLALWGMADYATSFLVNSHVASQSSDVFFIDLSSEKQLIDIMNKQICSPEIILSEKLSVVVVLVPAFFSTIKSKINQMSNDVVVLSVLDLFDPAFDLGSFA